jgi:formate hydrogenlyase subunit 3/multisubunit Na+/H+ antiporter MnhD subunit
MRYLLVSLVGSLLFLLGVALLYVVATLSLAPSPWRGWRARPRAPPGRGAS